jgi:3-methyl-2-oxobutanoate hydroxymethyltransferase
MINLKKQQAGLLLQNKKRKDYHADSLRLFYCKTYGSGWIDSILVGDSWDGYAGYDSTLKVTMEDMIHHTKAVVRGTSEAMVIADLPF